MTTATKKLIWTEEELVQGSPEWFEWRKGTGEDGVEMTLGGSEIAPLMYMSPYAVPLDVYNWKLGIETKEFSESAIEAMDRGTLLEPFARKHYEETYGVETRTLCAIHPDLPWMRTSLDGITEDNKTILEIKSPRNLENHIKQTKGGMVPKYRYPQLQHQIAVMREHFEGVEKVDYVSFYADVHESRHEGDTGFISNIDMKVIPVLPDEDFIRELIRRGEIMVELLKTRTPPSPTLFLDDTLTLEYPRPKMPKGVYWMPGLNPAL